MNVMWSKKQGKRGVENKVDMKFETDRRINLSLPLSLPLFISFERMDRENKKVHVQRVGIHE